MLFSAASLWEIAIKSGLRRPNFRVEPPLFRRNLLNNRYQELAVTGEHAVAVANLPPLHKDPFDRLLVAQSVVEGITLKEAKEAIFKHLRDEAGLADPKVAVTLPNIRRGREEAFRE